MPQATFSPADLTITLPEDVVDDNVVERPGGGTLKELGAKRA